MKLVAHRTLHVWPINRYIRLEKEIILSDRVVLQVPMVVRKNSENIDINNLVWDDDKQQYETHLETLRTQLGEMLNNILQVELNSGWLIVWQDKGIDYVPNQ